MHSIEPLEPRTLLAAGGLDSTFGAAGKVTTNFTAPLAAHAFALAPLPDGRTVVFAQAPLGEARPLAMVRFTANGRIDPGFGKNGQAFVGYGAAGDPLDALRLPDGKLLVVSHRGNTELSVARYSANGMPDNTFGHNGTTILPFGLPYGFMIRARLAIAPDGRIYVAVGASISVVRLTPNGAIDESFGIAGVVTADVDPTFDVDEDPRLTVRPDGRLIVAFSYSADFLHTFGLSINQFAVDGTPDPAFGGGRGTVRGRIFAANEAIDSIGIDSSGRILLVHRPAPGETVGAIARFRANGVFDRSFGTRGVIQLEISADDVTVQPDGRIILMGNQILSSGDRTTRVDLERLTPDGSIDTSFGTQGVTRVVLPALTRLEDRFDTLLTPIPSAALLADGRIMIATSTGTGITVVRLTSAGTPDPTYGFGGIAQAAISGPGTDSATSMVALPDGNYVVAGSSQRADGSRAAIVRYLPDNSPDSAFGNAGRVRLSREFGTTVRALASADNGKLFVLTDLDLIRLNANGSVDPTFGNSGKITALPDPVALAVTSDRRVLVVTRTARESKGAQIRRYHPDGSPDLSFASRGTLLLPDLFVYSSNSLLAQANGDLLLAGVDDPSDHPINPSPPWALYRITSDGKFDQKFGRSGIATVSIDGSGFDRPFAIDVATDGRIVLAGLKSMYEGFGTAYAVARLAANGHVDTTFADHGVALDAFPPAGLLETGAYANAVRVQPDGKILVLGPTYERIPPASPPFDGPPSLYGDWGLLRYNVDGTPDNDFGVNGQVTTSFGWDDTPEAALLTPDGKLLVAGTGQPFDTDADFALARYILTDPHPITARLQNRVLTITGTPTNDVIRLRIQNARLSVAGLSESYPTSAFSRIAINGDDGNDTLDASASPVPVTLDGGDGNDVLLGGASSDLLQGGDGHDTLFGGRGDDMLAGGAGNDYLSGGAGSDLISGDAGNDQILATDGQGDTVVGGPGFDRAKSDADDLLASVEAFLE